MKFIRDLITRKRSDNGAKHGSKNADMLEQSYRETIGAIVEENGADNGSIAAPEVGVTDMLNSINAKVKPQGADAAPAQPVNIWDMDDDAPSTELPAIAPTAPETPAAPQAAAPRAPSRQRRTKTRLIGFEKSDGDVVDLFDSAPKAAPTQRAKFPVGWIIVAEGPGRGECFSLMTGMSQIGRGEDQAVQLDFGDNSISRTNHAAIVYDPETKTFLLGHGGKSNIVRLNNTPVISNESLSTGDMIKIGETVLKFVALCDDKFNWTDGGTEENDDVAIA